MPLYHCFSNKTLRRKQEWNVALFLTSKCNSTSKGHLTHGVHGPALSGQRFIGRGNQHPLLQTAPHIHTLLVSGVPWSWRRRGVMSRVERSKTVLQRLAKTTEESESCFYGLFLVAGTKWQRLLCWRSYKTYCPVKKKEKTGIWFTAS